MKTTLLLNDAQETTRLMLKEVAFAQLKARESEDRAGCNCDRWGHPCPGCGERNIRTQAGTSSSSPVKTPKWLNGISDRIQHCSDSDTVRLDHRSLPAERV